MGSLVFHHPLSCSLGGHRTQSALSFWSPLLMLPVHVLQVSWPEIYTLLILTQAPVRPWLLSATPVLLRTGGSGGSPHALSGVRLPSVPTAQVLPHPLCSVVLLGMTFLWNVWSRLWAYSTNRGKISHLPISSLLKSLWGFYCTLSGTQVLTRSPFEFLITSSWRSVYLLS